MDWRDSWQQRKHPTSMEENALVSCCLCPHLVNTGLFPACINSGHRFVLLQCCQQKLPKEWAAGVVPSKNPPSLDSKLLKICGGQCQQRLGNLGAWGSRTGRLAHPSPRSKQKELGATGHSRPSKSTFLLCCDHSKVCSTSSTHKNQALK